MNSRQLNFYLNLFDQKLVDQLLASNKDTIVCRYQNEKMHPQLLDNTTIKKMGEEPLKIILFKRSDINNIRCRKIKGKNIYSIDTLGSPVIEYSKCYVNDNFIRRGRFYFVKSYYDEQDSLTKKSSDFLAWANQILDDTKKSLRPYQSGDFIGAGAYADASEGVKLVSI